MNKVNVIKGNEFKRRNLSFVMESFLNEERNSSESLKDWIRGMTRGVILRELTKEEENKLEQFKEKQTSKFCLKQSASQKSF